MNRLWRPIALIPFALAICFGSTHAQTLPVDDSRSQVLGGTVAMQWQDFFSTRQAASTLIGQLSVAVHLDVSAWQGRTAKIYQRLPAQPNSPVTARWRSQGRLLSGQISSGERALVYQGQINSASLQDTFLMQIEADGDRLTREQALDFSFEIELESP